MEPERNRHIHFEAQRLFDCNIRCGLPFDLKASCVPANSGCHQNLSSLRVRSRRPFSRNYCRQARERYLLGCYVRNRALLTHYTTSPVIAQNLKTHSGNTPNLP